MLKTKTANMTITETAILLNVSKATIRNWTRLNLLKPANQNSFLYYNPEDIISLKNKIDSGEFDKLNKRANKRNAGRYFIPDEYLIDKANQKSIDRIVSLLISNNIETGQALFIIALNLLEKENYIFSNNLSEILTFPGSIFKTELIRNELENWYESLPDFKLTDKIVELFNLVIPSQKDILGLIYQSLLSEGIKSKTGSYFTPPEIVKDMLKDYAKPNLTILDPCCGSGQFLLTALDTIKKPADLYGCDTDHIAVRIARLNIAFADKTKPDSLNIYKSDFLLNRKPPFDKKFDLIITNPPWGYCYSDAEKKKLSLLYPAIKSKESFSYFILRSIQLLKNDGVLSFVLPQSILNVRTHRNIRRYILNNCSIIKIVLYDRLFNNVFTPVIRLDLKKNPSKNENIKVIKNKKIFTVNQNRFKTNPDYIFDFETDKKDAAILDKIYSTRHITLKNKAAWALGIVTGNNNKFIITEPRKGYEAIYTGKDIDKYFLKTPGRYIKFTPDKFQQTAPAYKYRTREKLIYKFISKNLVFAYDNSQKLTLNSANILIPELRHYPLKVIMALFNSDLYNFIYRKRFSSLKILRGHLEDLPLPLWDKKSLDTILKMVDKIIANRGSDKKLNQYLMNKFDLTGEEQTRIREFLSE